MMPGPRTRPSTSTTFAMAAVMTFVLLFLQVLLVAQTSGRGTLTGTVTADSGQVIGFRVTAHNLDRRVWYTVFTRRGRYTVPQALPGRYEITVNEPGYEPQWQRCSWLQPRAGALTCP